MGCVAGCHAALCHWLWCTLRRNAWPALILQGEGALAAEQVAAARRQAELAAESIRAKAVEETQAKAVRS